MCSHCTFVDVSAVVSAISALAAAGERTGSIGAVLSSGAVVTSGCALVYVDTNSSAVFRVARSTGARERALGIIANFSCVITSVSSSSAFVDVSATTCTTSVTALAAAEKGASSVGAVFSCGTSVASA